MKTIAENLLKIRQDVNRTAEKCGRNPEGIQILAVSKKMAIERIVEARDSGQKMFGENRIQEAQVKIPGLESQGISWHFIGHLQSNKTRIAVELFDVIQTVHSHSLARGINRHCENLGKVLEVFIQVNLGDEVQKSGVKAFELPEMVSVVDSLSNLKLVGLMAIPPFFDDPEKVRPYFKQLSRLRDQINGNRECPVKELSMGMSGDYRVAIEEGSTFLRLGTIIFGPRGV